MQDATDVAQLIQNVRDMVRHVVFSRNARNAPAHALLMLFPTKFLGLCLRCTFAMFPGVGGSTTAPVRGTLQKQQQLLPPDLGRGRSHRLHRRTQQSCRCVNLRFVRSRTEN